VRSGVGVIGHSGERWTVDRMLSREDRTVLALLAICAADKAGEVTLSLQISEIIDYLITEYPGVAIVVTMVGYTSDEVSSLLEKVAITVPFRTDDYAGRLVARVERIVSAGGDRGERAIIAPGSIRPELERLETTRERDAVAVAERFNKSVTSASERAKQQSEARTVWELVQDLDRLRDVITAHGAPSEEREIIQGVIAWNSLSRKDQKLDRLAGLYLELVSMSVSAQAFPTIMADIDAQRLGLRTTLRNTVRGESSSPVRAYLARPMTYVLCALAAVWIFAFEAAYVTYLAYRNLTVTYRGTTPVFHWSMLDLFDGRYLVAWVTLALLLYCIAGTAIIVYRGNPVLRWEARVRNANRRLDDAIAGERSGFDSDAKT